MLKSFRVNGYKTFNTDAKIDFSANPKIKNKDYVFPNENLLKSALIYGPNNTGKTTFIDAFKIFRKIILDGKLPDYFIDFELIYNYFKEEKVISFELEFVDNDENSLYSYTLDIEYNKGIKNEILQFNNETIFDRNSESNETKIQNIVSLFKQYNNRVIIATLADEYKKYTDIMNNFLKNIIILDKRLDFMDIVEDVKNLTDEEKKSFSKIIKNADISIDDVKYIEDSNSIEEHRTFNLISYYQMNNIKGSMPSVFSDSDGTKSFMRYVLKIMKLRKTGGVLIIDEIDRSLHTLLTKSIISLFNSEDNNNIQLLASTHDLQLLDVKFLFRKDQIWFTYKDNQTLYFYSLNEFKANKSDIRNDTLESYLKGMFGALPHPNVEEVFYDI